MAVQHETDPAEARVPTPGRRLALPPGPIFALRRADASDYEIGEFRAWAGYKNLGADAATDGLAHFQHVLSFAGTAAAGRTGVHAHLADAHIVVPTSGRGVFSYDGVVTEAVPGQVIVQHGGTVHDQFEYSYAAASDADNRLTPLSVDPAPSGVAPASFGFLELFVPLRFANVEIAAPAEVTDADQRTAWDHPYHAPGARFFLQGAQDEGAAYRPVPGDLEARDAQTWGPTGGLVATWLVRPAAGAAADPAVSLEIPGESGGVDIFYMVVGSASFRRQDGEAFTLRAGDTLTCSHGLVGEHLDVSPDMRLLRFFISAKAETLRERTPDEIRRLESLGPAIITRREVRLAGDARPVNFLTGA